MLDTMSGNRMKWTMSISSKWNQKKEDQKAGLSFDWRFHVPSGWKLIYFCLPIAFVGLGVLACIEVLSDTSLKQENRRIGNIYYLKSEEHGDLTSFLSRNLPLSDRGPVWADPASLGVDSDIFPLMGGGAKSGEAELHIPEPNEPLGELDYLTNRLSLLRTDVSGYESPSATSEANEQGKNSVTIRPALARRDRELSGVKDSGVYPSVEGRPDMGGEGLETVFWVVVDRWGTPEHVRIVQESGDTALDAAAEDYIRFLRWDASFRVRSGELGVGWKEVPDEL